MGGGLSLGMLKQYVLHVYPPQSLYSIQSTYPTIFDSAYIVYDAFLCGIKPSDLLTRV
jgi:hypothetical protein